ncbi:recombinase family protein [Psychroflexus sp. CAK8W]|uniref:Recombinase family protein n=1 Tax=Psychroflexus longus TaxID=2873596 RepID=A0ABS7XLI2_9FLAO|nr:recombinase family protein [Psychroflexus longus]MBZ9779847.1 recombinase family protein [Psychroflexus longus]
MKVLYTRTSTVEQNSERQSIKSLDHDLLVEDKCSGAIPFFDREGGGRIFSLLESKELNELVVHQIDRLGRNLMDILTTIKVFNEKKVNIHFVQQGLRTLNDDGSENDISKMVISILGVVAEMERKMIRERQLEGIAIAKAKGKYQGRSKGTSEDLVRFLNKPKNKKAIELIKKGYKNIEVSKVVGLHLNTITKIKKINNLKK